MSEYLLEYLFWWMDVPWLFWSAAPVHCCMVRIVFSIVKTLYTIYTICQLLSWELPQRDLRLLSTPFNSLGNSNFIMQNMHLKKPNFNHVRVTIYSLNCLCLGNIQQQTRLRGLKYARETSKSTSGCLERTSLFKLRRNTQIPGIRSFSIFEIIRIWRNLWRFLPKYRLQWSKWPHSGYINPPTYV